MEERKMARNKGITLVALVITIIILLILAGISIATLTGQNGLLSKANIAGEETKKATYKEVLELLGMEIRPEKILEQLSAKEFMDRYEDKIKKEIEKEDTLKEARVIRKNEIKIRVITKEGYVFDIVENEVKYVGEEGELVPDLEEGDISFTINPEPLTNKNIEVAITTIIEGYSLQYSIDDGKKWEIYTRPVTMDKNGKIHARLWNGKNGGEYATANVTNIDKLPPKVFTPTATQVGRNIKLEGSTVDEEATNSYGCSGIGKYYFSKDNGVTWEPTAGQEGTSYTFENLTMGTEYTFKMKAVDKVGNEIESSEVSAIVKCEVCLGTGICTYNPLGYQAQGTTSYSCSKCISGTKNSTTKLIGHCWLCGYSDSSIMKRTYSCSHQKSYEQGNPNIGSHTCRKCRGTGVY